MHGLCLRALLVLLLGLSHWYIFIVFLRGRVEYFTALLE